MLKPFLLANGKEIQYEDAIKKKQDAVKRSLDEIFEDLKKNVETIYLLEQDDRSNLMRFIKGLDQFLQWRGAGSHKADECIAILSQDRSRAYRRASERDIRAGAKLVRDGVRGNKLSLGERERLLEQARKSGLRAAGRDTAKTAFLTAVLGKFDPQYLDVVYQCYQAVYHSYLHAVGRRGKKICSEEYIQYYEKSIFSKSMGTRLVGDRYDYLGFFDRKLKQVGKCILEDLRRGTPGKHWVKEENQKRVRRWLEELRKVGVVIPEFEEKASVFFLTDVTEKLKGIMQEAVADGEKLRRDLWSCSFRIYTAIR